MKFTLPLSAGRKNGPLLGAIFLSAAAHLAVLNFWPVVASGSPLFRPTVALNVSWRDTVRPPEINTTADTNSAAPGSDLIGEFAPEQQRRERVGGESDAPVASTDDEVLAWDVRYFSPRSLDRVPVAEQYGIPTAPEGENTQAGEVRLEVFIEADGSVAHVNVISASNLPPEYGAAASAALYRSRFRPGVRAGVAVPARLKVVVKYGLTGP